MEHRPDNKKNLLLAYVLDKASAETIRSISFDHLGLSAKVELGSVKEAIKYLREKRSPKFLIVDISKSDLPVTEIASLAENCEPGVNVIVVGSRNEVGVFRDLMELGVRDYIVKPLSNDLVLRSVENLVNKDAGEKGGGAPTFSGHGKLITFIGARGGVGTSILAANCAWLLSHELAKRTSLVDLDIKKGVIAQLFNQPSGSAFREALESPVRIDKVFLTRAMVTESKHLSLLTSEAELDDNFKFDSGSIEALLPALISDYQYTFIDTPFHIPPDALRELFINSDYIYIISDMSILSVRDTSRLLNIMEKLGCPSQRIHIICNKVGMYKKGEISPELFEETVGKKIDVYIPFDAIAPLEALNEATFVVEKNIPMSDAIRQMAGIIQGETLLPKKKNSRGIFNKLFGNWL
jgi:pilus assembly protein CpaE